MIMCHNGLSILVLNTVVNPISFQRSLNLELYGFIHQLLHESQIQNRSHLSYPMRLANFLFDS